MSMTDRLVRVQSISHHVTDTNCMLILTPQFHAHSFLCSAVCCRFKITLIFDHKETHHSMNIAWCGPEKKFDC